MKLFLLPMLSAWNLATFTTANMFEKRQIITPTDSIARTIQTGKGNGQTKFTLQIQVLNSSGLKRKKKKKPMSGGEGDGGDREGEGEGEEWEPEEGNGYKTAEYETLEVGELVYVDNPAVTPGTIVYSTDGSGSRRLAGESDNAVLMKDPYGVSDELSMAIFSINLNTGAAQGIVQYPGEKSLKIQQENSDAPIKAEELEEYVVPEWSCGSGSSNADIGVAEEALFEDLEFLHVQSPHMGSRALGEDKFHDHSHVHQNPFQGKYFRGSHQDTTQRQLQNNDEPCEYDFEVSIYLEIDQAFEDLNGGEEGARDYINTLFTAANFYFECEVRTHFRIAEISKTDRYDGEDVATAQDALNAMISHFGGDVWHTPGINLHHAMLGRTFSSGSDGQANDGGDSNNHPSVICNPQEGFGVSSKYQGAFNDISDPTYFDLWILMHELGHNFGFPHTHDTWLNPAVDKCVDMQGNCQDGAIPDKSGTIMSYCNQCGSLDKILYTFGGKYIGSGDLNKINNWENNNNLEGLGTVTRDPRRVPKIMYKHIKDINDIESNCVAKSTYSSSSPSASVPPTSGSSSSPSALPSQEPSLSPISSPSFMPSESPSGSVMPSIHGSSSPSVTPSQSAVPSPSPSFSQAPSQISSSQPSSTPSSRPSSSPSPKPSSEPSIPPSENPSAAPSPQPTLASACGFTLEHAFTLCPQQCDTALNDCPENMTCFPNSPCEFSR